MDILVIIIGIAMVILPYQLDRKMGYIIGYDNYSKKKEHKLSSNTKN